MEALINSRSVARLAAASVVVVSLAPVTAAASVATSSAPSRHAVRHTGLCDGHKWSLFGCRRDPGRHRVADGVGDQDADGLPSAG